MTEQLKALAEAASGWEWLCDDPGCGCREAMEAFQKEATPERILALIAENERLAHSRKDAEPVDIRAAMKKAFYLGQTYWQQADSEYVSQQNKSDATKAKFDALLEETVINAAHPPDADKLLQQALEALEYRLQQTRPIHQADSVMEAIRTYLEGKK